MDLEELLVTADALNRMSSIEHLKETLEKALKERSGESLTISYSKKSDFVYEWGLQNNDQPDSFRVLFTRFTTVASILKGSDADRCLSIEMKLYPWILFALAIKLTISTRSIPLNRLLLLSNQNNKVFQNILSDRLNCTDYESIVEQRVIMEQESKFWDDTLGLEVFDYFEELPKKRNYQIFETPHPVSYKLWQTYWICPRPEGGVYRFLSSM